MKTIKQIEIEPIFCEGEVPNKPSTYEEGKMYVSKDLDYIAFNCFCGCGGWHLKVDDKKKVTLEGSILQHDCKAHYVITKNKVNFL